MRPIGLIYYTSLCIFALRCSSSSPADCSKWGFIEPACVDCESFSSIVQDEELIEQCRQCCIRDESVTYSSATLQVCPNSIAHWPELKKFIEKTADRYKGQLKIKWTVGSVPVLKLKHTGGTETMRVDSWKAPQMEQFIKERVQAKK